MATVDIDITYYFAQLEVKVLLIDNSFLPVTTREKNKSLCGYIFFQA